MIDKNKIKLTADTMKDEDGNQYISVEDVRRCIMMTPEEPDIIRCIDCVYCKASSFGLGNVCFNYYGIRGTVNDDDFCSKAKKPEGE